MTYLYSYLKAMPLKESIKKHLFFAFAFLLTQQAFAQPVITSFSPASAAPGATVTITGTGFSSTAANNIVYFGAVMATVNTASATSLAVSVPMGATYSHITVTTGTLTNYSAGLFSPSFSGGDTALYSNSFASPVSFAGFPSQQANHVALYDFDGDGKPDILEEYQYQYKHFSTFTNVGSIGNPGFSGRIDFTGLFTAVADFDGDGKLDIAGVNTSNFSIYKNTSAVGNISFSQTLTTGFPTASIINAVAGDVDGDGKPDLILLSFTGATVYRNTSTGGNISFDGGTSFTTAASQPGQYKTNMAFTDIDGDGKPDLITIFAGCCGNGSGSKICILRNTSSPNSVSFASELDISTISGPEDMAVADFDGDGKQDIALITNTSPTVFLYTNTSSVNNISFGAGAGFALAEQNVALSSITAGDINGDGKIDIAVCDYGNQGISVMLNTSSIGAPAFGTKYFFSESLRNEGLAIGDVDGDGKPDFSFATELNNNSIAVMRNTTDLLHIHSFSPTSSYTDSVITITGSNLQSATSVGIGGIAPISFNIVNRSTITATVSNGATGYVYVTSAKGTDSLAGFTYIPPPVITSFTPNSSSPGSVVTIIGTNLSNAAAVSFGGTPAASFNVVNSTTISAVVLTGSSGVVSVTTPGGTGTLGGYTFFLQPVITSFSPASAAAGATVTITGTGFSSTAANDIVYFGSVRALVNTASTTSLTVSVPVGATYSPITVTTGALTAYSAMAFSSIFMGGDTALYSNSFAGPVLFPGYPQPTNHVALYDFDGDGKPDILEEYDYIVDHFSTYHNGSSLGSPGFNERGDFAGSFAAVADFDGDGKLDIAGVYENNFSIYQNTSTVGSISFSKTFSSNNQSSTNANAAVNAIAGDVDGDGKPDLVVLGASGPVVYRNTSSGGAVSFDGGTLFPAAVSQAGTYKMGLALRDIDGDGKADIIWVLNGGASSGKIIILRNSSSPNSVSFGSEVDISTNGYAADLAVADFDGDGKPDIALMCNVSSTITVYTNTSSVNNISFAAGVGFNLPETGAALSNIAAGDINGDGKIDLAVCDYGNRVISVMLNTSTAGVLAFGTKYTFPVFQRNEGIAIGDVDGDNLPDLSFVTEDNNNSINVLRNKTNLPHIVSFSPTTSYTDSVVTIKGSNFLGATSVSFGGTAPTSFNVVNSSTITATISNGASGYVYVTLPAGTDSLSGFTYIPPPTITAFTPDSSYQNNTVTITGTNFSKATVVSFGGTPAASFAVVNSTTINAVVSTGSSGAVSVLTPGGVDSLAGFTFFQPPAITSFSPENGNAGASFTINGSNFAGATAVNVGGLPVASFTIGQNLCYSAWRHGHFN